MIMLIFCNKQIVCQSEILVFANCSIAELESEPGLFLSDKEVRLLLTS